MRRLQIVSALTLISCAPEVSVEPPQPGSVSVTVASNRITEGGTIQATATAVDSRGTPLPNEPRVWTSSAPAIASVSATGVVTGLQGGTTNVSATVLGRTGSVSVTVDPRVASVTMTSATTSVRAGVTVQITATARDATGNPIVGRSFTWSSSNAAVAAVNSSGLVTGQTQGTATITATADGVSGTRTISVTTSVASVVVTPNPFTIEYGFSPTRQLSASPQGVTGTVLTGRTVSWSIADPSIATVSAAGLVTAVRNGTTEISAQVEGVVGTSRVTVACYPATYTLGATVTGELTSTDCIQGTLVADWFSFSSGAGRLVSWSFASPTTAAQLSVRVVVPGANTFSYNNISGTGAIGHTLYGTGAWDFYLLGQASLPIGYQFTTLSQVPDISAQWPTICSLMPLNVVSGSVTVTRDLRIGTCEGTNHQWRIYLRAGQQITVTQSSSEFDSRLELYSFGGSLSPIAQDDNGGGGFNSRLIYSATSDAPFILRTTRTSGTGVYTMQYQITSPVLSNPVSASEVRP